MIQVDGNDYILTPEKIEELKTKINPDANTVENKAYQIITTAKSDKELSARIKSYERYCKLRREHIGADNYDSAVCKDLVLTETLLKCIKDIVLKEAEIVKKDEGKVLKIEM